MALKLFRTTGYSTLLAPGEARQGGHHSLWVVAVVSLWIAFACNVALWRLLAGSEQERKAAAVALLAMGGASAVVLSAFAWRRTIKPVATLLLIAGALLACGLWAQGIPVDAALFTQKPRTLLPAWPTLLRWQVPALLVLLGLAPAVWVWNLRVTRLPGPVQLRACLAGMLAGAAALIAAHWLA